MTKRIVLMLFTVVLVLALMSSVAFAAAPTSAPTLSSWTSGNGTIGFTWSAVSGATGYNVYKNGVKVTTPAQPQTELTYSESGLTNNTKITYDVKAVNADGESTKKLTVTISAGGPAYNADLSTTIATTDAQFDNGINNANLSGVGVGTNDGTTVDSVIKSDGMTNADGTTGNQRTHAEYQNNTNSCASCHQTHTAAAKNLLFKDGVYTTCTACHDGTLGFYNVFEIDSDMASAGTFGGNVAGNTSVHMVTGAINISAAPGGYSLGDRGGKWTGEFNCASCHSPHGSYSDRLLHYNPNGMAATNPDGGGLKVDRKPVYEYTSMPTASASSDKFIAVRGTKTQLGLTSSTYDFIPSADKVIVVYEKKASYGSYSYSKTTNPWMYGYPTRGSGSNNHWYYTRFFTADPATILNADGTYPTTKAAQVVDHYDYLDGSAHIKYAKGLIYGTVAEMDALTYAEIARSYVVKLDLLPIVDTVLDSDADGYRDYGGVKITTVNQRALFAGETHSASTNIQVRWGVTPGSKVSGWGVAMSTYCSSCHVDYLAASGSASGTFNTTSYRHTTTSDSYTCVRCHFAHGTDVTIMRDAQNRTVSDVAALPGMDATKAASYMLDQNPSSALKRFTNMAVCWACHTSSKAEQLKNTDTYEYNADGSADPRGLQVDEGTQNWPLLSTPAAPSVTADDTTNTITGLASGMEYSLDSGTTWTLFNGSNYPDLSGDKTVQVRVAAVPGVNNAGAITTLTFTAP
ncbi:MAG: cytochrome c3 family protein [Bacillota bacterium]